MVSKSGYQTWTRTYAGNPVPDQRIDVFAALRLVNPAGSAPAPAGTSAIPPVQSTSKAPISVMPVVAALFVTGLLSAVVKRME